MKLYKKSVASISWGNSDDLNLLVTYILRKDKPLPSGRYKEKQYRIYENTKENSKEKYPYLWLHYTNYKHSQILTTFERMSSSAAAFETLEEAINEVNARMRGWEGRGVEGGVWKQAYSEFTERGKALENKINKLDEVFNTRNFNNLSENELFDIMKAKGIKKQARFDILRSDNITDEILRYMLTGKNTPKYDFDVLKEAVNHTLISPETLTLIVNRNNQSGIVLEAARNPKLPTSTIRSILQKNQYDNISISASENPNAHPTDVTQWFINMHKQTNNPKSNRLLLKTILKHIRKYPQDPSNDKFLQEALNTIKIGEFSNTHTVENIIDIALNNKTTQDNTLNTLPKPFFDNIGMTPQNRQLVEEHFKQPELTEEDTVLLHDIFSNKLKKLNWYKKSQNQNQMKWGQPIRLQSKYPQMHQNYEDIDETGLSEVMYFVDEDEKAYYVSKYKPIFGQGKRDSHSYDKFNWDIVI